jgi:ribosomal protein L12E/L44/L45/RPP1/RPP2
VWVDAGALQHLAKEVKGLRVETLRRSGREAAAAAAAAAALALRRATKKCARTMVPSGRCIQMQ